jgi:energy-coupling factor transporter transmembrane protein EcfT
MKIMLMVSVVTILVSTTTNTQLTNAITNVLLPLKIFKAPVAE